MNLQQTDVTGSRIVGAITKPLGHAGPKHHGVVLGKDVLSNEIYIVEFMDHGYQASTYTDFHRRYAENGQIFIQPNTGPFENIQVAQQAINEIRQGGGGQYDLIINNCESFVNRATHGKSVSTQVINTALGVAMLVGLVYVLRNSK